MAVDRPARELRAAPARDHRARQGRAAAHGAARAGAVFARDGAAALRRRRRRDLAARRGADLFAAGLARVRRARRRRRDGDGRRRQAADDGARGGAGALPAENFRCERRAGGIPAAAARYARGIPQLLRYGRPAAPRSGRADGDACRQDRGIRPADGELRRRLRADRAEPAVTPDASSERARGLRRPERPGILDRRLHGF